MKKIILLIALLLISKVSWASCVPLIKTITQDAKTGVILVASQYTINGVLDPILDVKTYFPEKTTLMTDLQLIDYIKKRTYNHCDALITQKYVIVNNVKFRDFTKDLGDTEFKRFQRLSGSFINYTRTMANKRIKMDSDGDGKYDKEWTLNTNGTRSVKSITPINP